MPKKLTEREALARASSAANSAGVYFIGFSSGKYENAKCRVKLQCPEHGQIEMSFDKLTSGTGCRECGFARVSEWRKTKTKDILDKIQCACDKQGFKFIEFEGGSFSGVDYKAVISCNKHGNFSRRIADLLSKNYACPQCDKLTARVRNRMPEDRAHSRWVESCNLKGLEFLGFKGPYESADITRGVVRCKKHGEFYAAYSSFVLIGTTCSACARVGFNYMREAYIYALSGSGMLKIGITNSPEKRIKNLRRDTPFDFEVLEILRVPSGSKAKTIEKRLHDSYESAGLTGFGGCTEWLIFNREILTELKRQVEKAR